VPVDSEIIDTPAQIIRKPIWTGPRLVPVRPDQPQERKGEQLIEAKELSSSSSSSDSNDESHGLVEKRPKTVINETLPQEKFKPLN
jgi:hypothetical protein